jgi:low affinity Fe/Cu permease
MPSEVSSHLSWFDRLATAASGFASRAVFFTMCLLIVVLWLPTYFVFGSVDTWQLLINTLTTIVTFLLVALLQNSQRRSENAVHQKLNAIADGLADLMADVGRDDLRDSRRELRLAVGLEDHESS